MFGRRPKRPQPGDELPEQLDREAEITPDDVERAKLAWKRAASPEFREFLAATPLPDSDQEAEVTPMVEREADIAAEQYSNALFRAMLDATPMPEEEETRDAL